MVRSTFALFALLSLLSCSVAPPGSASSAAGVAEASAASEGAEVSEPPPSYTTLDTDPAPVLDPEAALESFSIAPGFAVELVAAEPLVEDPVAVDWDEEGRLYVAEMRAFMTDVHGTGEERPIGSVVRLTDDDGDGVMDRRELVLDGLVLPRALRIVNDGLLVGEMGKLWLCPTPSGWSKDIDCAQKVLLGPYGEHQGSVEHAENGLLVGLDNWIYSAKSKRRLKLSNGKLIEEPTVFRGQWGITQDDLGRLFYNTNSNLLLGDFFDGQAVVAAGNRTAPGLNERVSANDEVFSVRVNPGVNRAYVPGVLREDGRLRNVTAASGMVVYRGGRFDERAPAVFVAEPAGNLVAALRMTPRNDGIGVTAEPVRFADERWGQRDFFASTDERFRPVDVVNGPDGSLYVVDFYRGIIQDHVFISDELKAQAKQRELERPPGMGRIWRVVEAGAPAKTADALPLWPALSAAELVALLDAPDIWRRSTAQRLLLRATDADVDERLALTVSAAPSQRAAVHALWTLHGRGALTKASVKAALAQGGALAEAALLAGGALLDRAAIQGVLGTAAPDSRTYLYALGALRHSAHDADAVPTLAGVLQRHWERPYVRTFAQAALRGRELKMVQHLLAAPLWSAEQESATNFLALIAQQYFRAEGGASAPLLDTIASLPTAQRWAQQAMLAGLFETTREPGFTRAELDGAHPLFAIEDDALWPSISRARRGFTWPGDTLAPDAKPLTPGQAERMAQGAAFYTARCANCHGTDGAGVGAAGPPLKDSPWVTQAPERLARIVLQGLQGPIEVHGVTWNAAMPAHGQIPGFDDHVASGLLTYLRRAWGHAGRAIDPDFVARVRAETAERTALWTVQELSNIDINTHFAMYEGTYGAPGRGLGFEYDGRQLNVKSGIFNGPLQALREDHFLFAPRGLKFEFVPDDEGVVRSLLMHTGEGAISMPRLPQ